MTGQQKREVGIGLAALAIAALGWFVVIPLGIDMPQQIDISALSPDFWPRIVMVLLALSGVVMAVQGVLESRHEALATEPETVDEDEIIEHAPATLTARVVFALAMLFVFYVAIFQFGIVVSSALIIILFTYMLGQRQWKYILPLAVLLPVILYFFFVYVANIPMPLGMFENFR